MNRWVLLSCLAGASVALACDESMPLRHVPWDREAIQVARGDLSSGEYQDALEGAQSVLEPEEGMPRPAPSSVRWARRVAGIALLRLGKADQARTYLLQSLKDFRNEPYVKARLAEAEVQSGHAAEGKARLEELAAKGLVPDAAAHVALARARLSRDDRAGARAAVAAALRQDPKNRDARELLGQLATASKSPARS